MPTALEYGLRTARSYMPASIRREVELSERLLHSRLCLRAILSTVWFMHSCCKVLSASPISVFVVKNDTGQWWEDILILLPDNVGEQGCY
jgi:hypothetical protein